jgi:uncharacterized protein YmfQ (DUF2313 family)
MDVIRAALNSLFPRGHAWRLGPNLQKINAALSAAVERLRQFYRGINRERLPLTAVETLLEWAESLGLTLSGNETIEEIQGRLEALDTATGGQMIAYINGIVQTEFPDIVIEAFTDGLGDASSRHGIAICGLSVHYGSSDYDYQGGSWLYYLVTGTLRDGQQQALANLLAKIAPAHMQPIYRYEIVGR